MKKNEVKKLTENEITYYNNSPDRTSSNIYLLYKSTCRCPNLYSNFSCCNKTWRWLRLLKSKYAEYRNSDDRNNLPLTIPNR